jgi:site-specific DNA-methyltransferase (adenine-specific)
LNLVNNNDILHKLPVVYNSKKILSSNNKQPYFNRDGFSLYHANCLDILSDLPENSIDTIFADPPYNLSNGGFSVHAGKRVSVNKGVWDKSKGFEHDTAFHQQWISACRRVLKPEGTIWISGTYHSIYQCGYILQQTGFHLLNAWCEIV